MNTKAIVKKENATTQEVISRIGNGFKLACEVYSIIPEIAHGFWNSIRFGRNQRRNPIVLRENLQKALDIAEPANKAFNGNKELKEKIDNLIQTLKELIKTSEDK